MKIKYVDVRPLTIPYLKYHRGGVNLPSGDNELKVSESEFRNLMKMRNGQNKCFEEIKKKVEVKENGSRE
jgi:hypothetical protein